MGLTSVLQRFAPTRKAVPLFAPEGLIRAGTACSLELLSSPGFLFVRPMKRSFPSFHSPLVSSFPKASRLPRTRNLRVFRTERIGVSPERAPACSAFGTDYLRHLFKRTSAADYFFVSKS